MAKGINPNERKAADHYILHGSKVEAYRHAYDVSRQAATTQGRNAVRLFDRPHVMAYIMETQQRQAEQFDFEVSKIKKMLVTAAAEGLKKKRDRYGNMVPVSLQGTVAALSELNRMDGNHAPTRSEVTGKGGAPLVPRGMNAFYDDLELEGKESGDT